MLMDLFYPYHYNSEGRTASRDTEDEHLRDMIEQLLFTTPGERVNRPDFGSGLLQLVFQGNSPELAATTQFLVQAALNQWLGDRIQVMEVNVVADDSKHYVTVVYANLRTQQVQTAQFVR